MHRPRVHAQEETAAAVQLGQLGEREQGRDDGVGRGLHRDGLRSRGLGLARAAGQHDAQAQLVAQAARHRGPAVGRPLLVAAELARPRVDDGKLPRSQVALGQKGVHPLAIAVGCGHDGLGVGRVDADAFEQPQAPLGPVERAGGHGDVAVREQVVQLLAVLARQADAQRRP